LTVYMRRVRPIQRWCPSASTAASPAVLAVLEPCGGSWSTPTGSPMCGSPGASI